MALDSIPINMVDETHLQHLISNQVSESKKIEYKLNLPGRSDANKREFLADVSSFTNASGGDIFFGIEETNGIPTNLPGLPSGLDAQILRLEGIIQSGLQPRIPGLQSREIRLSSGRSILHIRIPKSWVSPHLIVFKNYSRFYSRNSAGKYQLDVSEIRNLFLASDSLSQKIQTFRADRISKIVADETPIRLQNTPKIILHIIPMTSFNISTNIDFNRGSPSNLGPINSYGFSTRHNFDGLVTYSASSGSSEARSYVQVFRNGIIEAVAGNLISVHENGMKSIPGILYERQLIESTQNYLNQLQIFGVDTPIVIMLSLLGVMGASMGVSSRRIGRDETYIDRDQLIIPEVLVEEYTQDVSKILHPIFDTIWNAAGWNRCINYDSQGNWVGHV